MKRIVLLLVAVAGMAGVVILKAPASGRAGQDAAPAYVTTIPQGYRDWRWISSAH
jgi:hypothetical protein